jgi:hypothetical protein
MKKLEMPIKKLIIGGLSLGLIVGMASCSDNKEAANEENDSALTEMTDTPHANTSYFTDWDTNNDSYLDENEYSGGVFSSWDANKDNRLDENEWNTGARDYGITGQSWADWDLDTDGFLNDGEYRTASTKAGWYRAWDSDGDNRLSQEEYDQGMSGRSQNNE